MIKNIPQRAMHGLIPELELKLFFPVCCNCEYRIELEYTVYVKRNYATNFLSHTHQLCTWTL